MVLDINLPNLIIFVIAILVMTACIIDAIRIRIRLRRAHNDLTQAQVDSTIYMLEMAKLVEERDSKSVEETQGFLKFVSDSRDWAFKYIEDIQEALDEYDAALNTDDAKIINEAYKKLIDFLPKDDVVN